MKKIIFTGLVGLVLLSSSFAELIKTKAIPNTTIKMGITEVTVEQYVSLTGENPGYSFWPDPMTNRPIDSVSWYECAAFCNLLSMKEGLKPVYSANGKTDPKEWKYIDDPRLKIQNVKGIKIDKEANGYRLPSYKEWITACKGEGKFKFPGSDDIKEVAWYKDTANVERNGNKYYSFQTHTVATKKPNEFGLYDMAGNVKEWANDVPIFPRIQYTLPNFIMGLIKGYLPSRYLLGSTYMDDKRCSSIKFMTSPTLLMASGAKSNGGGFRVCLPDPNAPKK